MLSPPFFPPETLFSCGVTLQPSEHIMVSPYGHYVAKKCTVIEIATRADIYNQHLYRAKVF